MAKPYTQRLTLSHERSQLLAERVRAARTSAKLTQEALAAGAGLTTAHLQRLEGGTSNPTLATLFAISDFLRLPIGALLPSGKAPATGDRARRGATPPAS